MSRNSVERGERLSQLFGTWAANATCRVGARANLTQGNRRDPLSFGMSCRRRDRYGNALLTVSRESREDGVTAETSAADERAGPPRHPSGRMCRVPNPLRARRRRLHVYDALPYVTRFRVKFVGGPPS